MEDKLRAIRQELFARRNGALAESLRAHGDPHRLILGCTLSEIAEVAGRHKPSAELARALWAEWEHRECRLLAPMLFPVGECDVAAGAEFCATLATAEEADVLCHRLLRRTAQAQQLMLGLLRQTDVMQRYAAFRLMLNLLRMGAIALDGHLAAVIQHERSASRQPAMRQLLRDLCDEAGDA